VAQVAFDPNQALTRAVRRNFSYWEDIEISRADLGNVRYLVTFGFEDPRTCDQALALAVIAYPVVERYGDISAWIKVLESATNKFRLDKKEASRLVNLLGLLNWRAGDFETAKGYHEEAITLSKRSKFLLAESKYGLAQCHWALGDYPQAEENCNQALRYFEGRKGFRRSLAAAQNLLGMIHFSYGNSKQAVGDFYRAYSNYSKAKDCLGMARSMNNRAMNKAGLGETRQAISFYNRAAKLFAAIGDDLGVCQVTTSLGILYFRLGRLLEAREAFQRAAPSDWGLPGVTSHRGWVSLVRGYLYLSEKDSQNAIILFEESLSFWQVVGNARMEMIAQAGLTEAKKANQLT
jgi:tetratricopeptide (TPR) repeat protein